MGASALASSTKALLKEYRRLQTGFYLPTRFRGPATSRYLSAPNPLVRFSIHDVLNEGMSFLDIGAGIGVASALAARTPSVRITAIELNALMRSVLRSNLALLLPATSVVPSPPVPSGGLRCAQDGLDLPEYIEFVKDVIASVSPDAIRLNGSHVELFLPFVCLFSFARVVMTETDQRPSVTGSSHQVPLFPPNVWNVMFVTTSRFGLGGPGRHGKFIFVAKQ